MEGPIRNMSAIPIAKPNIHVRPRARVTGVRGNTGALVMQGALTFGVIAVLVFGASSLFGHVMVEKARREGIAANRRLKAAVAAQSALARQIEALSDEASLKLWAKRNGMVAPDLAPKSSGSSRVIVARR